MVIVTNVKNDVTIKKAPKDTIQEIYDVLSESFTPYHIFYTEEAYEATVIPTYKIKKRIEDQKSDVLIAIYKDKIVGTASIEMQEETNVHIRNMAVKPKYQKKGIGRFILDEICTTAKEKHTKTISLECFGPLINAVSLYERCGFRKTGTKRNYHGIEIFKMVKRME